MKSRLELTGCSASLHRRLLRSIVISAISLVSSSAFGTPSDWGAYLRGARHSSFNPGAGGFTPITAIKLHLDWTFTAAGPSMPDQPTNEFVASATVWNGIVYIGANTGVFYAINEKSGTELWHRLLGYSKSMSCPGRGISSTATIKTDSTRGGQLTVYVGGGDGYLYALRASDGVVVWRRHVVDVGTKQNTGYNWASPTVIGGHIYMGISSDCDNPLVRGGIKEFDQASGALLNVYWSVPAGSVGGSVWTSPASDGKSVWATIGNSPETSTQPLGDCFAIVRLDASTQNRADRWVVSPSLDGTDLDWGSSPTLFNATINGTTTTLVGAANKDGKYYAFKADDLASGPIWIRQLGATGGDLRTKGLLLAAAIWDSTDNRLFVASNQTSIQGKVAKGSVRQLDPGTGAVIWQTGLPGGPVMGTPTLSGGGVIAAGTYNNEAPAANKVYVLDAVNGSIINTLQQDASIFSQPIFSDTHLFIATSSGKLMAYRVAP
jgi:outer membrane protein assembly factor BamB